MKDVKLRRGLGLGHYDVLVDGEKVGEVWKKVQNYNLRRAVTTVSWLHASGGFHYRTREAAVQALLAELREGRP